MLNLKSTVKLNNGIKMPLLGLGTWQVSVNDAYDAVSYALKIGYRHIDTAKFYGNEAAVGRAIRDSGIDRGQIFVTTKLWPSDFLRVGKAFENSLRKLNTGYIDLYLIHWPVPGFVQKTWREMEKIYKTGQVKSIGVSNYSVSNLDCTLRIATVKPMVNQVKCSPYNYDPDLHRYCTENGIVMEAYSPLTRGNKLSDSKLSVIADKYNKSTAQVLLRWCIQKGIPTIPKSIHRGRITENKNIYDFELSRSDIETLDKFNE